MAEELNELRAAIQHELELARCGEGYEEAGVASEIVERIVAPMLAKSVMEEALRWRKIVEQWEQGHQNEVLPYTAKLEAEVAGLKAAIADIDAHATPVGLLHNDDPEGSPHHYLLTVGALHRALGKAYTAEPCESERARLRSEVDTLRARIEQLVWERDEAREQWSESARLVELREAVLAERDLAVQQRGVLWELLKDRVRMVSRLEQSVTLLVDDKDALRAESENRLEVGDRLGWQLVETREQLAKAEDRLRFVARRYLADGSGANFRSTRCTGVSSDALAWYAVGIRIEPMPEEYPRDPSDLAACERTYEMAPEFLRERMAPVLARYRAAVAKDYPEVRPQCAVHPEGGTA